MKVLLTLCLFMTTLAFAAKEESKSRKMSSSHYFICNVERDGNDKKEFKNEYHFPFPVTEGEEYSIKGSQRWNKLVISFKASGKVSIQISEVVKGEMVTVKKEHDMGKDPQFQSFKVQVDVKKDDVSIPYVISCNPE